VEGYTTPGGYSSTAVKPIALAKCMAIAQMVDHDFSGDGRSLSGLGGVNTGRDAAEFILLGSDTVQVGVWVGGITACWQGGEAKCSAGVPLSRACRASQHKLLA
jgi:dihydroorotate dehydrogenase